MSLINDIDNHLSKANSVKGNYVEYLNILANLILEKNNYKKDVINSFDILLDFENSQLQNDKRFTAIIFLVLLNENSDVITFDNIIKHKIVRLFDITLKDLYKSFDVKESSQAFEKIESLKRIVKKIDSDIQQNIPDITSLSMISNFENRLRSTLKNKTFSIITTYYITEYLDFINVDQIFHISRKYIESNSSEKVRYYNQLDNLFLDIESHIHQNTNKYAQLILINPLKKLKNIISYDFNQSNYSKNAKLSLVPLNKKYPLHLEKNETNIGIKIHNLEQGIAFNVYLKVINHSEEIEFSENEIFISSIDEAPLIREFPIKIKTGIDNAIVEFEISYENYDGSKKQEEFIIEFFGQDIHIDWDALRYFDPYSLEAVDNENELIGREEIINLLVTKCNQVKIGSQYIFGQRRVGKTSIAQTLISKIKGKIDTIYIEAGDWSDLSSSERSADNLGKKICQKIIKNNKKFEKLTIPSFEGSFSRITDFLDDLLTIDPDYHLMILLDEFDRISEKLYSRGDVGKAFMLTIRSISNRPNFGFILIGGEKLEIIIAQWQELNKFERIRIDYFDNSRDWEDFKLLVRNPLNGKFEFTDEAVSEIYKQSAGNPYFTKLICSHIFNYMKSRKDNYITQYEVNKSLKLAMKHIGAPSFSHFWEDGIKEGTVKEEEISVARRKVILSTRDSLTNQNEITKIYVREKSIEKGLLPETADNIFDEFIQRNILKENIGKISFVMEFFKKWLLEVGYDQIIPTFEESEKISQRKFHEEQLRIKSTEVDELLDQLGTYKSQKISSNRIIKWLSQFGEPSNQRLIFKLLKRLKFYNDNEIRTILELMYHEVQRRAGKLGFVRVLEPRKKKSEGIKLKRNDFLVSYIDAFAKSGSDYSKKFVEANNIYYELATDFNSIPKLLEKESIKILLLVDDISVTGKSFVDNIKKLNKICGEQIRRRNILIFVSLITGFLKAKQRIEDTLIELDIKGEVLIMNPLTEEDRCFSDNSKVFDQEHERILTKELCTRIGSTLEKQHPLGYEDSQLAVVFPDTCPNNTLPIFWKKNKDWEPLFERT